MITLQDILIAKNKFLLGRRPLFKQYSRNSSSVAAMLRTCVNKLLHPNWRQLTVVETKWTVLHMNDQTPPPSTRREYDVWWLDK